MYRIAAHVEHTSVVLTCVRLVDQLEVITTATFEPDLSDETGGALLRQIDTRISALLETVDETVDTHPLPVDLVLPGSLDRDVAIVRSSRLNIRSYCCPNDVLHATERDYRCINDVYASALGQIATAAQRDELLDWRKKVLLFVYVDEGVGSLIFHDGKVVRGYGYAGPLGHAIVEPRGQYFDEFRARGSLESYCSRPWMSANIVNHYYTEREKRSHDQLVDREAVDNAFVRALRATPLEEKSTLSYEVIDAGVRANDRIALLALDEAADCLGLMISHLIVALNPHLIVVDGLMPHKINGFFERLVYATQRYTWVDAWNVSVIKKSERTPDVLIRGAAYACAG